MKAGRRERLPKVHSHRQTVVHDENARLSVGHPMNSHAVINREPRLAYPDCLSTEVTGTRADRAAVPASATNAGGDLMQVQDPFGGAHTDGFVRHPKDGRCSLVLRQRPPSRAPDCEKTLRAVPSHAGQQTRDALGPDFPGHGFKEDVYRRPAGIPLAEISQMQMAAGNHQVAPGRGEDHTRVSTAGSGSPSTAQLTRSRDWLSSHSASSVPNASPI